jgi:hypothetical protein
MSTVDTAIRKITHKTYKCELLHVQSEFTIFNYFKYYGPTVHIPSVHAHTHTHTPLSESTFLGEE